MKCAACQAQLETITYEGIEIEACPSCGGEWLDAEELKQVVKAREVLFTEDQRRAIAEAPGFRGVSVKDEKRRLACPKCGAATQPINYAYESGVVIDRCGGCRGIWLDADELEKTQMLFEEWSEQVPETLAKFRERLQQIEAKWEKERRVRISRFGFVNALITGILDIVD